MVKEQQDLGEVGAAGGVGPLEQQEFGGGGVPSDIWPLL